MNKNALYGLIGIAVFELIAIIALSLQVQNQKLSPNILSLTQPVTYLNGTVKNVSGDTITVIQNRANFITVPPPGVAQGKLSPTPTPPLLSYEVTIDKKTVISRPLSSMVMFLFGSRQNQPEKPTIKDIKQGDQVSVQSASDLRLLGRNRFTATAISLPPVNNNLTGSIVSITSNTVLVRSAVGAAGGKDYLFNINKDTEISAYAAEMTGGTLMPAPKRYALSDLKPQQLISVWTNEDIAAGSTTTALRIQPMATPTPLPVNLNQEVPALPPVSATPTLSPQTTPKP